MTMTRFEAQDRAARIWGAKTIAAVERAPADRWHIDTKDGAAHMLDENGHTVCHDGCAKREARLP